VKPAPRFLKQPKLFWANVRAISEQVGYTARGEGVVKVPTLDEMVLALERIDLKGSSLRNDGGKSTKLGRNLSDYFEYRADVLNRVVEPNLMDAEQAKAEFKRLVPSWQRMCPLPLNKQKGKKKAEAYFTCIINMIIEAHCEGHRCNFDPRGLTTVTKDGEPLRTLARRVDGGFPSTVNPIAVWEIKEYYCTTTFGSRVADGVYESLLDGMELEEIREELHIDVKHYLFADAHYTWWDCGKSYLCRIVDMLHMGYVDEVLFGREVMAELPRIVKEWVAIAKRLGVKRAET
jgi:hypothetical protein